MSKLKKKIFIIDDDVYIGDMLEEALQKAGYEVSRAYSGTEALLLLEKEMPDLVLLDLMLPGLSGEEVLSKIREIPGNKEKLRVGNLVLDYLSHEVSVSNKKVRLTKTEFAILKLLMQNPGQAMAKTVILDRISDDTLDCTESSLKQHISNLRRKLGEEEKKEYIESVWGIGFRLVDEKS